MASDNHYNIPCNIQENVNLQSLNTLSIPASAQWFCCAQTDGDIKQCLDFIQAKKCPLLVLGGGSNVLLPESFEGLVLVVQTQGRSTISETENAAVVEFAAGENWHEVVRWSVDNGFSGIENLALIPGSIGAAPIQNIGAYGVELESCFEYVTAIELATGKSFTLNKEECQFAYRDSIFKHKLKDKVIITRVALRLSKTPNLQLKYPALVQSLAHLKESELTPKCVAKAVIQIRQSKLPDPKAIPNAGSFFKNPVIDSLAFQELKNQYPDVVAYELDNNHFKLAAGWLLDKAGWKGKDVEGISMHSKQALVLTNPEEKTTEQILMFADTVCKSIKAQFNVDLEIEPRVFFKPKEISE